MIEDSYTVSPAVGAVKDITFGSVAGMVSKVFEHPFDLTKVRLQSQVLDGSARFKGPIDCLVRTFQNEGVRGLFRGLPAPVAGAMAENATLFVSYSQLQHVVRRLTGSHDLSLPQLAVAGASAGAVTSFVLTPVELVKCKMQVQMLAVDVSASSIQLPHSGVATATLDSTMASFKPQSLPGPLAVFASVVRNDGFCGLWLGQTGTLIREIGGGAAWFACKEFVAMRLVQRRANRTGMPIAREDVLPWESAVSGACAGAIYSFSLFPADTVKSAMQTAEELRPRNTGRFAPPTFLGTARALWKAQGIRGFYAGCGITVAKSIPSSAIIFLIYDGLRRRFP